VLFKVGTFYKLYQGSRNFSEQKFRFPWHKMKFTINWLFCPYRSNQHRSWTILHSHLLYWWTVILSNWKNGKKHGQHNKKQGPHSLFLQTGNLPSSCVSIRIFNLTSQIDIECVVSWATRRSLHGVGFQRIEDHGVTLLTVASWRGDLVSIKYISSFLWISLRNVHNTQEAGKWWAFWYEIRIIIFFHS
jgi:hypothetical protein